MAEESSSNRLTDLLITFLAIGAVLIVAFQIILPMFKNKSEEGNLKLSDKFINDHELDAEKKACIAMNLCRTERDGKFVSKSDVIKWQAKIMENAHKIFPKLKSKKENR